MIFKKMEMYGFKSFADKTEIKYYGADIKSAYKKIEAEATDKLMDMLDDKIKCGMESAARCEDENILQIVKAADKLDAYIKCCEERCAGNRDFAKAERQTLDALKKLSLPEVDYFMENYMPAFTKTVDEL